MKKTKMRGIRDADIQAAFHEVQNAVNNQAQMLHVTAQIVQKLVNRTGLSVEQLLAEDSTTRTGESGLVLP